MRGVFTPHLAAPWKTTGGPPLTPLRAALLALLTLLVVLPARRPAGAARDVADATVGAAGDPPAAWLRTAVTPPDAAELDRLAALAGGAPLFAAAPPGPLLLAVPPERPRAGRNAAIEWRFSGGTPGDTVRLLLLDAGGPLDSARIALDRTGSAAGAFRVHPAREGWHDWRIVHATRAAPAGAWVSPPRTIRALLVSAPGSVEARDAARALERGGVRVTIATDLGRGLTLGPAPAGLPVRSAALDSVDVVLVLAGVSMDEDAAAALRTFVERGGGVLVAGAAAAVIARATTGPTVTRPGADLAWSAPAALEPLPPFDAPVAATPFTTSDGAVAASLGEDAVLVVGTRGRGRWAALGLLETWRWGLLAGRTDAHARFWTSLAAWLAGGAADPVVITPAPATAPPGLPVDLHLAVLDSGAPLPASVSLRRPDGSAEPLPVAWSGEDGVARFLPTEPGTYQVSVRPADEPLAGFRADPAALPAARAWADLARIAAATGGRLVPADSLDDIAATDRGGLPLRALLAVVVVTLAIADWARRRLRGSA